MCRWVSKLEAGGAGAAAVPLLLRRRVGLLRQWWTVGRKGTACIRRRIHPCAVSEHMDVEGPPQPANFSSPAAPLPGSPPPLAGRPIMATSALNLPRIPSISSCSRSSCGSQRGGARAGSGAATAAATRLAGCPASSGAAKGPPVGSACRAVRGSSSRRLTCGLLSGNPATISSSAAMPLSIRRLQLGRRQRAQRRASR